MSFLHTADSVERWVITPMESLLTEWTRRHLDKFANFWFRSPRMHVLEAIGWNTVALALFVVLVRHADVGTQVEQRGLRPRPWHDVAIGLLMLVFYGLQMYIKFTRGGWNDLAWMLMPCHVYTLSLAFCLLSRNRVWVNRVFTIIPVCHAWNPIMALAFPDFSDQIFAFEKPVYIIHHIVIIALPYYMATQHDRFTILPLMPYWFGWVLWYGIILQFDLQTLASYISGINVNYQLVPPPLPAALSFLRDKHYRLKMFFVLALCCLIMERFIRTVATFIAGPLPPLVPNREIKTVKML